MKYDLKEVSPSIIVKIVYCFENTNIYINKIFNQIYAK